MSKSNSRTENAVKNVKTGMFVQLFNKVLAFFVRTVFIHVFNSEYLGVNGLFTNILTILSFAELGVGTAIIFSMYKPVAENDIEKVKSLMLLYKRLYTIIGLVIIVLGLCLCPFLKYIVKDVPNIKENIVFIYVLLLFNTGFSYFYSYKKSIIYAHQKQSIINKIDSFYYLFKSIVEVIIILLFKNFILYLMVQIVGTIVENIVVSKKAEKLYPYLNDKNVSSLDKNDKKDIFLNVKSLFIYTIGGGLMNGIDNILISSLLNVTYVGLCSNYYLIINSVKNVISTAISGLNASVGNLNATGSTEKKEEIFMVLTFLNYFIYSFCAIAFVVLLGPFVEMWIGKKYVLSFSVLLAMAINFFVEGIRNPGYVYRTTLGLFKYGKITPYIGAISNIISSIIFCKLWGLAGIFMATFFSQAVSFLWIDPYLVYKYDFKKSPLGYYKKYINYFLAFGINMIITLAICNCISNSFMGFLVKCVVVLIIPNVINITMFLNKFEFKFLWKKMKGNLLKGR